MALKQVIVVRADLKLAKGKLAAQASHASVDAMLKADDASVKMWRAEGMKKVVLKVENVEELLGILKQAQAARLPVALITDAGLTHLEPGTTTCLGIGPAEEERINKVTGHLKLIP